MAQQALWLEGVKWLNNNVFGYVMIGLLLFVGVYYTVRLRFVQRRVGYAWRQLFRRSGTGKATKHGGISPFQALSTSIAAQVGTGNIVGVATAIASGGAGAVFWMWIAAILGMATNFAEAVLSQRYKTTRDGTLVGGPAFYLRNGVHSKFLAGMFAVACILALGLSGIMVQANSIVMASSHVLPDSLPNWALGLVLAVLVGAIISGGVVRIVKMAERVVPWMAIAYLVGGLVVLAFNYELILWAFGCIFEGAFSPRGAIGGAVGIMVVRAIRYGVARGLFSNEAGLGSTPHAHALAKVKNPCEQGQTAMVGISVDLLVCTITALTIIVAGTHVDYDGVQVAQMAFASAFHEAGPIFVALALLFFSITTIIGWYFFAAQNVRYLFGEKLVWPYRILVLAVVICGALLKVDLVWELADAFNLFMVIPNVVALLILSPEVAKEYSQYRASQKEVRE